jgi:2-iminobutanoate/2-iminopropanoate deaminase
MRKRMFEVLLGVILGTGLLASAQHKAISTPDAPRAIGPYSQAIRAGDMLFLAGQIAIDPKTQQFNPSASIEDQTRQTLENLKAVLAANTMTMRNVVSASVFMKDLTEFAKMNTVYATYFKEAPPARVTVQVAALPRDAKIEISLIAMPVTPTRHDTEFQPPLPPR